MQLAERIFVKENAAMAELCRKQTPVYNQALWVFRREHFGWEKMDDAWRKYYGEVKIKNGKETIKKPSIWMISCYDVRDMMRWLPIYRAATSIAANTVQRVQDAITGYWNHLPTNFE